MFNVASMRHDTTHETWYHYQELIDYYLCINWSGGVPAHRCLSRYKRCPSCNSDGIVCTLSHYKP